MGVRCGLSASFTHRHTYVGQGLPQRGYPGESLSPCGQVSGQMALSCIILPDFVLENSTYRFLVTSPWVLNPTVSLWSSHASCHRSHLSATWHPVTHSFPHELQSIVRNSKINETWSPQLLVGPGHVCGQTITVYFQRNESLGIINHRGSGKISFLP